MFRIVSVEGEHQGLDDFFAERISYVGAEPAPDAIGETNGGAELFGAGQILCLYLSHAGQSARWRCRGMSAQRDFGAPSRKKAQERHWRSFGPRPNWFTQGLTERRASASSAVCFPKTIGSLTV